MKQRGALCVYRGEGRNAVAVYICKVQKEERSCSRHYLRWRGGEKTGKINIYLLLLAALQIQHQGGGRVIRLAGVDNTERMEKGKEHSIKTN